MERTVAILSEFVFGEKVVVESTEFKFASEQFPTLKYTDRFGTFLSTRFIGAVLNSLAKTYGD